MPNGLIITTVREILDGRLMKKDIIPRGLTKDEREFCERVMELRFLGNLPKLNKYVEAYEGAMNGGRACHISK